MTTYRWSCRIRRLSFQDCGGYKIGDDTTIVDPTIDEDDRISAK